MILGINGQNHDASMALIDENKILWAAHAERYSRIKNDTRLCKSMVDEMFCYGEPKQIIWFENHWKKNLRKLVSGERPWYSNPKNELKLIDLDGIPLEIIDHHESHAAGGFYTSNFKDASILVVDAIGEWDTVSVWKASNEKVIPIWKKRYPNSIGLFYTAMTDYIGLKPNEEEYILMGMSAIGKPIHTQEIIDTFFKEWSPPNFKLKYNLHRGCRWWKNNYDKFNLAASVQEIVEIYLIGTVKWIKHNLPSQNLIFMGGVALNCVANTKLLKENTHKNLWIMPNPGDAGSAIGAVAAYKKQKLEWKDLYLGTNIERNVNINEIVAELLKGNPVGIANGRAEFGPRALGNRSLLLDPRQSNSKEIMNKIKKRELFRPFSPSILTEFADEYFDMPIKDIPYMQYTVVCKKPESFPGICHVDNTSRIQTVSKTSNSIFREILEQWYHASGCPMLLNTSLNIKQEPLVNSINDALRWEKLNKIRVF